MQKYLWQLGLCAFGILLVGIFVALQPGATGAPDPKSATYLVEGAAITLASGRAETTMIFGEPVFGDINGDGLADAAVMLVQEPGGTGTFYYLAAAVNTGSGYQGTNALFLGDRIAPQNVSVSDGVIIANFAERGPNEPFTTRPSFGRSFYASFVDGKLIRATR